jgi:hypothetical protein
VEAVAEHTANHQEFKTLVEDYAQQIIDRTRRERLERAKKKTLGGLSAGRKTKNSNP